MFIVTNCICTRNGYVDGMFTSREEAEEVCAAINKKARRGLCAFSEVRECTNDEVVFS